MSTPPAPPPVAISHSNLCILAGALLAAGVALEAMDPAPASAQTTILSLSRGTVEIPPSNEIAVRPLGGREEPAREKRVLKVGDMLLSRSTDLKAVLGCPGDPQPNVTFSGRFVVVIQSPESGSSCVMDLVSGRVDVQAHGRTIVKAGGITLGSEGTLYGARLDAVPQTSPVFVLDGAITARPGSGAPRAVTAGRGLTLGPRYSPTLLDPTRDLRPAARIYAERDLARAGEGRAAALETLVAAYQSVFQLPQDAGARLRLASLQLEYGVPASAILYQLDRVDQIRPGLPQTRNLRGRVPSGGRGTVEPQSPLQLTLVKTFEPPPGITNPRCSEHTWIKVTAQSGGRPVEGVTVSIKATAPSWIAPGLPNYSAPHLDTLHVTTGSAGQAWFSLVPGTVSDSIPVNAQASRAGYQSVRFTLPLVGFLGGCQ